VFEILAHSFLHHNFKVAFSNIGLWLSKGERLISLVSAIICSVFVSDDEVLPHDCNSIKPVMSVAREKSLEFIILYLFKM
jgi:hypothetical protein